MRHESDFAPETKKPHKKPLMLSILSFSHLPHRRPIVAPSSPYQSFSTEPPKLGTGTRTRTRDFIVADFAYLEDESTEFPKCVILGENMRLREIEIKHIHTIDQLQLYIISHALCTSSLLRLVFSNIRRCISAAIA
jgi:hypothetical protein